MKVVRALVATAASCLLFGSQALPANFPLPSDQSVMYSTGVGPGGLGSSGYARFNNASAGTVKLVSEIGGKTVYVTQWHVQAAAGVTVHFSLGVNSNCATGLTQITDDYTSDGSLMGIASPIPLFATTRSTALCAVFSGAAVGGVTFSQI